MDFIETNWLQLIIYLVGLGMSFGVLHSKIGFLETSFHDFEKRMEKKLDRHNHFVERVYMLEKDSATTLLALEQMQEACKEFQRRINK